MNARRYFSPRYWASRYWARGSDTPPAVVEPLFTVSIALPIVREASVILTTVRSAQVSLPLRRLDNA
jgi:hypothetical protein